MDELIKLLVDKMDIESIFVVQGATALVKFLLNVFAKDKYTDFYAPFVAVTVGQVIAYASYGIGLNSVLYGLKIGGSAIVFSVLFGKTAEGINWFKNGKSDPVLKAKVEQSAADADSKIQAVRRLLKKDNQDGNS